MESKGLLGLTYRTLGYATHIVTVWGAEYDNQGKIRAVYITDSDDQQEQIGLKRMGITRDASGNPRLNNHVKIIQLGRLWIMFIRFVLVKTYGKNISIRLQKPKK